MPQSTASTKNRFGSSLAWILVCISTMAVGCGPSIEVAEVTGVVTMDGKPMDMIYIEFWSTNGPRSFATTDADGKFELTFEDEARRKGAVPGDHKVSLRDLWPTKDDVMGEGGDRIDMSNGKRSRIDTKYFDAVASPLTMKVESGKKNYFEIKADAAPTK
jgi:hypothetical protein